MSKKAHTPGPWRIERGKKYGDFLIWSAHGETEVSSHWIATLKCESCPAHEEANARLIAAAPEMLEALIEAKSELRDWGPDHPAIRQIDAALSKATGGE